MKLEIKLLNELAKVPTRAHQYDAGLDLYATSVDLGPLFSDYTVEYEQEIWKHKYVEYGTGIAVNIPRGYVGLIFPRSSVSKTNLTLANAVGVIDSGYTGEIRFRFRDPGAVTKVSVRTSLPTEYTSDTNYKVGDAIGQLVVVPIELPEVSIVSEFSNMDALQANGRLEGSYGSTGN